MNLTAPQLQAFKTDIAANAALVPAGLPNAGSFVGQAINSLPNTSDAALCIASFYNQNQSPAFWVWRTSVSMEEYTNSVAAQGGTTFAWTGAGFITRSQGERDAWTAMFRATGAVNPSLANVRQAFSDIFSGGTAPAPANRTHLTNVSMRQATRFERLFATGTGSTASPGLMVLEGQVAGQDVENAKAS